MNEIVNFVVVANTSIERLLALGAVGAAALRESGARAVIVLPLRAGSQRLGTVILAHAQPVRITARDVEPLELLVSQLAATLAIGEARHAASNQPAA